MFELIPPGISLHRPVLKAPSPKAGRKGWSVIRLRENEAVIVFLHIGLIHHKVLRSTRFPKWLKKEKCTQILKIISFLKNYYRENTKET